MITIIEFLLKKKGDGRSILYKYKYHPKTKKELQDIIVNLYNQCIYDLNCIDTSEIKDMSELFDAVDGIGVEIDMSKIDISGWNVSNVEDMSYMFYYCKSFNCDLSKWNVSNVIDMSCMFGNCERFNCDLSNWNVSNVITAFNMFIWCPAPKPTWYKDLIK